MDKLSQRILTASVALFADRGFERVTVRDIVEAARIHMPALYRKFGDKQQLYLAVVRHAFLSSTAEVLEPIRSKIGSPEEKLFGYVLVSLRQIVERHPCTRILDREILDAVNPVAVNDLIDEVVLPLYANVAEVVKQIAPSEDSLRYAFELGSQAYAAAKLIQFRRHTRHESDTAFELATLATEITRSVLSQARDSAISKGKMIGLSSETLRQENERLEGLLTRVMVDNVKLREQLQRTGTKSASPNRRRPSSSR